MRKREQEKFHKLLVMEKQAIVDHLAKLEGVSTSELAQGGGDSVDIAAMEITQASIQKLGNREKKLVKKIDHALAKFETGDYGTCEHCGESIATARLEARPVAQYCIDCKTEMESNERRYSDSDKDEDGWSDSKSDSE